MILRTKRLAVLPVAVALVGFTLAAPGHSEVTRPKDQRGDVAVIHPDGSVTTAAGAASVDIVKLVTNYGPRRLAMTTRVVDLDAQPHGRLGPGWQFKTARPGRWNVVIHRPAGDGEVLLSRLGKHVPCGAAKYWRMPLRNLYRVTIP